MQRTRCLLSLFAGLIAFSPRAATITQEFRRLPRTVLEDKIRGGWAGQMIGVSFGAPTEFKSNARINDAELKWDPGMVENSIHQDDLYVEMTFSIVMDTLGLNAT